MVLVQGPSIRNVTLSSATTDSSLLAERVLGGPAEPTRLVVRPEVMYVSHVRWKECRGRCRSNRFRFVTLNSGSSNSIGECAQARRDAFCSSTWPVTPATVTNHAFYKR